MKKTAHILAAVALMFGLAGCTQEKFQFVTSGEEVKVSVSAALNGGAETKAYGDAGEESTANRAILEVYLKGEDGKLTPFGERKYVTVTGDHASFPEMRLVTGHTYLFVLWADKVDDANSDTGLKTDKYYNTTDFNALTYSDVTIPGNSDDIDAFYTTVTEKITESKTIKATLTRPFGQLNIYTKDYDEIPEASGLQPKQVSMHFSEVPSGLNLLTGEVLNPQPMNVEAMPIAETETSDNTKGRRLSFNYIFTMAENAQAHLLDGLSMSFFGDDVATTVAETYDFPANIPVQRNWRTNIVGNLLTDGVILDIELNPVFDGDLPFEMETGIKNIVTGKQYETIAAAIAEAEEGQTIAVSEIECADELTVPKGVILDGAGTAVFSGRIHAEAGATLRNFTSNWGEGKPAGTTRSAIEVMGSDVTIENVILNYTGEENRAEAINFWENADNVKILNSTFSGYWKGLYIGNGSDNIVIEGNVFNAMNPFSIDQWTKTLSVKDNTFNGNQPTWRAIQFTVAAGTEGMAGTTKYQESWPLALKESVYAVFSENTFENPQYMRVTYLNADGSKAWDTLTGEYDIYFHIDEFLTGDLANAHAAFTTPNRHQPSAVEFLDVYMEQNNVVKYVLDESTSMDGRDNTYKGHFYNTQGRNFYIFNPEKLTKWEITEDVYVDGSMITDKKPFRSELWSDAINLSGGASEYPLMGITNINIDADERYVDCKDKAVVRVWLRDKQWTEIPDVEVKVNEWNKMKIVSDGQYVTYWFNGVEIAKYDSQPREIYVKNMIPFVFHFDWTDEKGRTFYENYTSETYFSNITYKLTK